MENEMFTAWLLYVAIGAVFVWSVLLGYRVADNRRRIKKLEDSRRTYLKPLTSDNPYQSPANK